MTNLNHEQLGELLSAYLDGELAAHERATVERLLREDEGARQLLDELRRTVDAVASLPRHAAPAPILDDVRLLIERGALLGDSIERTPTPARGRPILTTLSALAAMIGLMIVAGLWYGRDPGFRPGAPSDRLSDASSERMEQKAKLDVATPTAREEKADSEHPLSSRSIAKRGAKEQVVSDASSFTGIAAGEEAPSPATIQAFRMQVIASAEASANARGEQADQPALSAPQQPVLLRLAVTTEEAQSTVSARIAQRLAQAELVDQGPLTMDGGSPLRSAQASKSRGRQTSDERDASSGWIVLRVPLNMLAATLDDLAPLGTPETAVSLQAGAVEIRGLNHAREALRGLDAVPEPPATLRRFTKPGAGLFADLFKAVGVDPERFTPQTKTSATDVARDAKTATAPPEEPAASQSESPHAGAAPSPPSSAHPMPKRPSYSPDSERSLVERRTRELEEGAKERESTAEETDDGARDIAGFREQHAEPGNPASREDREPAAKLYVTLIVDVVVAQPVDAMPIKGKGPESPAMKAKADKPLDKRKVNN